jgi:hypothetical protein
VEVRRTCGRRYPIRRQRMTAGGKAPEGLGSTAGEIAPQH